MMLLVHTVGDAESKGGVPVEEDVTVTFLAVEWAVFPSSVSAALVHLK